MYISLLHLNQSALRYFRDPHRHLPTNRTPSQIHTDPISYYYSIGTQIHHGIGRSLESPGLLALLKCLKPPPPLNASFSYEVTNQAPTPRKFTTYLVLVDKAVGFPSLAPNLTTCHLWSLVPYFIFVLYSYQDGVDPSIPLTYITIPIYFKPSAAL